VTGTPNSPEVRATVQVVASTKPPSALGRQRGFCPDPLWFQLAEFFRYHIAQREQSLFDGKTTAASLFGEESIRSARR
jgi:hypothetical protein